MNTEHAIMFEKVLPIVVDIIRARRGDFGSDVVLVRDLLGRIRVLLRGDKEDYGAPAQEALESGLSAALGAYAYPEKKSLLFTSDLLEGERVFQDEDRRLISEEGESLRIWLLDRQIIGQDWMRPPLARTTSTRRVTFYGIKGGVGRSTALAIWAWQLAKEGKQVLIFDLDLESPGISSTLLPLDFLPDYGIVDWFVEDGVGQAQQVEDKMIAVSPLATDLGGGIRVVPAFGRETHDYLPKLARCYAEHVGAPAVPWSVRLQRMVERIESSEKPDVVFFDSRAGLHDVAAVLVTRMEADVLLFAVESTQTWNAYSFLFRHWRDHPRVKEFRQRLQMVAGMVPETGREEHLRRFRERSWELFREHLYDEASATDPDAFSFDLGSEEAPHYPLPIFWNRALQEFDPAASALGLDQQIAESSMGLFMSEAKKMVFSEEAGQ